MIEIFIALAIAPMFAGIAAFILGWIGAMLVSRHAESAYIPDTAVEERDAWASELSASLDSEPCDSLASLDAALSALESDIAWRDAMRTMDRAFETFRRLDFVASAKRGIAAARQRREASRFSIAA